MIAYTLMTSPNPPVSRIAFASFIGTAIEYYDFYIYGLAVAMVIGPVFFPGSDPAAQALNAFLTFGIAFVARPIGSLLFGHFGDKAGRKTTLVASLVTMGAATFVIGLLPGYQQIGWTAPLLLCLLRFAQGIGLGGEWGGAALLAAEYAPAGRRGWYGMFPQLGPSIGFLLAVGSFLLLTGYLDDANFRAWGWRIPFLASSLLVITGLYVRMRLAETPVFARALHVNLPAFELLSRHLKPLLQGALLMVVCYALFYITTVFSLSYGTSRLGYTRMQFLSMLCIAVLFMAAATPLSAMASDRFGRRPVLIAAGSAALPEALLRRGSGAAAAGILPGPAPGGPPRGTGTAGPPGSPPAAGLSEGAAARSGTRAPPGSRQGLHALSARRPGSPAARTRWRRAERSPARAIAG